MTIKKKLLILLSVLFVVIVASIALSGVFVKNLINSSEQITQDNYRSLLHIQGMQVAIDSMLSSQRDLTAFNMAYKSYSTNFKRQSNNVTEPGEATLNNQVKSLVESAVLLSQKNSIADSQVNLQKAKFHLNQLFILNEKAVEKRTKSAAKAADDAVFYSSLFSLIAVLITLFYIIQIPKYLTQPIATISKQMLQVADGNYDVALKENRTDEFKTVASAFNTMADRLKAYEKSNLSQILQERNRLESVVDQFDMPILGIASDGRILFVNTMMLHIMQRKKSSVLNLDVHEVAKRNDFLASLLDKKQGQESRLMTVILDDKELLFSQRTIFINSSTEEMTASKTDKLIVLNDVTDFIKKDTRKTQFMATLSHELKTPIAAIEMGADLLKSEKTGGLKSEQLEYVKIIEEQVQRIRRMVNEVLDLSKIESGIIDFALETVQPHGIALESINTVQPFIKEKNINIRTTLEKDLPSIKVDHHKLLWALNNFLSNAIRYTELDDEIVISVSKRDKEIVFEVTDFGKGIPLEQQRLIFEKYVQLNKQEKGGTGLGLAISKEFIEAMNGSIGVKSEVGKGSTFWIKLPTEE